MDVELVDEVGQWPRRGASGQLLLRFPRETRQVGVFGCLRGFSDVDGDDGPDSAAAPRDVGDLPGVGRSTEDVGEVVAGDGDGEFVGRGSSHDPERTTRTNWTLAEGQRG
jgi:hypothetical protein